MKMKNIFGYSKNPNVQMLITLMLEHGIRRVIVSPGGTHNEIVAGFQYHGGFDMYSTVDERGAAYMACGMAGETGEPVAIVCTESVASRNYYPAITEAYYRQLPILAITGVHSYSKIGHLHPQFIDRSASPADSFKLKVHLPEIKGPDDIWESNILINKALLELRRHGGGPVHIDLPRSSENEKVSYTDKELIKTRVIRRYTTNEKLPDIHEKKIAVYIGTHQRFSKGQTEAIDRFCAVYDAVVFCGHTSGYHGKYRVLSNSLAVRHHSYNIFQDIDLLIHLGGPAADTSTASKIRSADHVWRVNPDGEIRDTFEKLTNVFEMKEETFFEYYGQSEGSKSDYLDRCLELLSTVHADLSALPFSNVYAASEIASKLPEDSFMFLGGSSTIRAWSMFDFPKSVDTMANMGTRGIDGVLSSFLGTAFVEKERLCFCVLGDLTFFYDMNALGNRDLKNNVRILLVNDGGGGLFRLSNIETHQVIGDEDASPYIAAAGHFGNQSRTLVKSYAESLGFEYLSASSKEEFESVYERFITPERTDKPMLFEMFTNSSVEREAFDMMSNVDISVQGAAKQAAKRILGQKGIDAVKKLLNK